MLLSVYHMIMTIMLRITALLKSVDAIKILKLIRTIYHYLLYFLAQIYKPPFNFYIVYKKLLQLV